MKRALTIAAGVAVGLAVIVVVLLAIQFLISGNLTGVDVHNDSGFALQGVAVVVPGASSRGQFDDMAPGDWGGFGVDTQMFLPLRIVFDAQGQHHEVSRRVLLPPVGAYSIKIHIDPQMNVKVVRRILW